MIIAITSIIIAIATMVYAYYARKTWYENKRLAKIQMMSSLEEFVNEFCKNLEGQITSEKRDCYNRAFRARLLKKWFPDEFKEMGNIAEEIFKEMLN